MPLLIWVTQHRCNKWSNRLCGVTVVEINPKETPLTPYVTYALPGLAGAILPELLSWYSSDIDYTI